MKIKEFNNKEFMTGDIVEITLTNGKKRKEFLVQGHAFTAENESGIHPASILVESGENEPRKISLEDVKEVIIEARANI